MDSEFEGMWKEVILPSFEAYLELDFRDQWVGLGIKNVGFHNDTESVPGPAEHCVERLQSAQILTKVVATESGNTDAVMANAAVVAADVPSASTMRIVNDRAMKSTCSVTRSNSLKYRSQTTYDAQKLAIRTQNKFHIIDISEVI